MPRVYSQPNSGVGWDVFSSAFELVMTMPFREANVKSIPERHSHAFEVLEWCSKCGLKHICRSTGIW